MKRLLIFGTLLLLHLSGCQTELEPRLRKSRLDLPTASGSATRGITIEYKVVYGLDLVEKVFVSLHDTPPTGTSTVDGRDTEPNADGRGSISIRNVVSGRRYELRATAVHKDKQIPNSVSKQFFTIP